MENQPLNGGHDIARAEFEFDEPPVAPSPSRAQPPHYIYRLDYEKRFLDQRPSKPVGAMGRKPLRVTKNQGAKPHEESPFRRPALFR